MNSLFNTHSFFKEVEANLDSQSEVNWHILYDLSKSIESIEGLSFSFFNDRRSFDLPFEQHLGYLNVEDSSREDFLGQFKKIILANSTDVLQLANIFVLYTRISANEEFLHELLTQYKSIITVKWEDIFKKLIASLNDKYFAHHYLSVKQPKNVQEWLDIFRSAQGFHTIQDSVIEVLKLIPDRKGRHIDYNLVLQMRPLLRATLMGWYNFEIDVKTEELFEIIASNETEAAFVAATLLDDIYSDATAPPWLNTEILRVYFKKYWLSIGKPLFVHTYGISYRNKSNNQLFSILEGSIDEVIRELLSDGIDSNQSWINKFDFPETFTAFFSWAAKKTKMQLNDVPASKRLLITNCFVDSLETISIDVVKYISRDNHADPFNSYSYTEVKYQTAFSCFLMYLIAEDNHPTLNRKLNKVFLTIKPLYYGGYNATLMATRFTEFVLMIFLSIDNLHNLSEKMLNNFSQLLTFFNSALMIPYIHLAERDSEIWDYTSTNEVQYYNASKFLINTQLKKTLKGHNAPHISALVSLFEDVKVANWPYER